MLSTIYEDSLRIGLEEDEALWDFTTLSLRDQTVTAEIVAKEPGIWTGEWLGKGARRLAGGEVEIRSTLKDGERFKKGQVVCRWKGSSAWVLRLERPFLNLLAYSAGIAKASDLLVTKLKKMKNAPRVVLTRKILPSYRDIAVYSARLGGAYPHRVGLAGGILIKENHIVVAGGLKNAIARAREHAPHTLRIEVEVKNQREVRQALQAGADIIMLDNFPPEGIIKAVDLISGSGRESRPLVEVSGGIAPETIEDYAINGVDYISVGSLTHSVRAVDFSLLIRKKTK